MIPLYLFMGYKILRIIIRFLKIIKKKLQNTPRNNHSMAHLSLLYMAYTFIHVHVYDMYVVCYTPTYDIHDMYCTVHCNTHTKKCTSTRTRQSRVDTIIKVGEISSRNFSRYNTVP